MPIWNLSGLGKSALYRCCGCIMAEPEKSGILFGGSLRNLAFTSILRHRWAQGIQLRDKGTQSIVRRNQKSEESRKTEEETRGIVGSPAETDPSHLPDELDFLHNDFLTWPRVEGICQTSLQQRQESGAQEKARGGPSMLPLQPPHHASPSTTPLPHRLLQSSRELLPPSTLLGGAWGHRFPPGWMCHQRAFHEMQLCKEGTSLLL